MADQVLEAGAAAADRPAPFVGRRRELAELRAEIDRPGLAALRGTSPATCRVLLIAGRPGSGRTSLAVRLAAAVADRYPDGCLFARLTGNDGDPVPLDRVAHELLAALRAAQHPAGPAAADGLVPAPRTPAADGDELDDPVAALRTALAGRRVLLLLDEASHGEQVLPLLPSGSGALAVVTSQGPLGGVPDVRPCTLGGLELQEAVELLTRIAGPVRLTNDPVSAELLVNECQGGPAALRLAAGWLAARPGRSVGEAVRTLRDMPDEQSRSAPLYRAFRLVYGALPTPAARLARLLALAPDGAVDVHIASALAGCSLATARGILGELRAQGLLHPGPAGTHQVPGCLHPFLTDLLDAHERPAEQRLARARMLERTVRLLRSCRLYAEPLGSPARRAVDDLPGELRFPSAEAADHWLRDRLPVLLAAARTAAADGELDRLARRLVAALVKAVDAHRRGDEAVAGRYELHGLMLEVAERRREPRGKAAALIDIADLDAARGRTARALRGYRAALDAARAGGDASTAARAAEALGDTYRALDDRERAADWYDRALALRQSRGELAEQVRLHGRLGALAAAAGRYGDALRAWRAATAVARRQRDPGGVARALAETAVVQERAGEPEESLATGQEALRWARRAGDTRLEAGVLLRTADTLERLGDAAGARLQRQAAAALLPGPGAAMA